MSRGMPESGERQGSREIIDRHTARLRESGIPADKAREMARQARVRNERRDRGER
jgi:hypothetical protein